MKLIVPLLHKYLSHFPFYWFSDCVKLCSISPCRVYPFSSMEKWKDTVCAQYTHSARFLGYTRTEQAVTWPRSLRVIIENACVRHFSVPWPANATCVSLSAVRKRDGSARARLDAHEYLIEPTFAGENHVSVYKQSADISRHVRPSPLN